MPRPADPVAVYAHTPAGVAERNEAQDLTALADSFDAATRAMKQTIISFVSMDTRDLLYIDEALTTQTVHGMLTILEDMFGEMPPSQQHALAASLRNPFSPRTETVGQFLSNLRHVRSTLAKVGQIFSDDVFSEYICNAIILGAPEFAVPLDYYRNTSEARDLNRLYRIINDKATTMAAAQANAVQHRRQALWLRSNDFYSMLQITHMLASPTLHLICNYRYTPMPHLTANPKVDLVQVVSLP
jgi:hypothetical protein